MSNANKKSTSPDLAQPNGPIAWMARNPIAANLLMALLLAGGIWTAFAIQKEVFPEFALDVVTVSVGYPGAAPSEVEQGILRPVEQTIRGIDGIREITSEAREGRGTVTIELVAGTDRGKAFQDIDQAVNRIRTFPDDIDEPDVSLRSRQRQVVQVVLYGSVDVWTLRVLGEQLRDQLRAHPSITQVELRRVPDYVTHVEVPRDKLREYGLTLPQIARIISTSAQDTAAGAVQTSGGEILLRVKSRKQWAEQFAQVQVLTNDDGTPVLLGDLASIRDGFDETNFHSQFDQKPAIEVDVYRVGNQSPIDVANAVYEVMDQYAGTLPPGVDWRIDRNSAEEFRRRLALVIENGFLAVVIVLIILALFLEIKLAFWVMMGMATSFIGGILLMPVVGVSINMISLFGFLVVLGIVVDDAIVVGENIYEKRQQEPDQLKAAILGTREIAGPVTFSILSNIVAFIPLMFIPGETGKFWGPLPIIVILVLALSLVEALFILPAHLGHVGRGNKTALGSKLHDGQQVFSGWFTKAVNTLYKPLLGVCLRFRYATACGAAGLFIVVGGYAVSAHMGMIMMPEVAADEIEAGVRLPVGTTPDQAARVAQDVTRASMRMFEEHNLHEVAEGIKTNVRRGSFIDVEIVMRPPDERNMTANEVIELWRDSIGDLPGVDRISFEAERGPGGWRKDISIDLSHNDIDVLEKASQALMARVETITSTRDVDDNYNKGKKQYDFRLTETGRALGLTPDEVGAQVRGAFYGSLALRLLRGTNEVEVRVKLPKEEREMLYHLEDLVIQTPSGAEVPLMDVVQLDEGDAFTSISRRNGRRAVSVAMNVEPKREIGQVIEVLNAEILPELAGEYPGLTWTYEGSNAEMRSATATLWGGFGLAMAVIYSLLAIAFRDYFQPLIVLVAIPFGIIGAVIGHMLLGYDLSLISFMGVIALSGVVVNDALIMVDFANRQRREHGLFAAVQMAGVRRFRPIFLTTATTFCGLMPIIFESSLQAQYLIPMAISLGFGIVFATSIILVLVPCLYLILEDIRGLFGVVVSDQAKDDEPDAPEQLGPASSITA